MDRRMLKRAQRQAVLAAIARREWLLQMLALGAAGCRRSDDPAYSRSNTLVVAVNSVGDLNETPLAFFRFPRLTALDANGELEPRLAQSWEHSPDNTVTAFAHRRVRGPSTTYHGADDMMEDLWLEKER